MINKKYEMLLNENYTEELFELILEDYIKLFAEISNERIEDTEENEIEKVFIFFFWKVFKYCKNFVNEMFKLKKLFSDFGWNELIEKDMLIEIEKLYYDIKEKSKRSGELNISEYLKELINNDEYELAIEIVKHTYYYPLFVKMLKEKDVKFDKFSSFSDILKLMKKYYGEYIDVLLNIDGIYPYKITAKEKLNDLLELTDFWKE